ncbi:30S ribosomal protein S6 [Candidatus Babeliales bacterium]|nr:30S ribosomal protein S6 [Candidatus Babeliales bacterium]
MSQSAISRYEVLFLTVPEITKDEAEAIKAHFAKVIRTHKATMVTFDRWGKYRLAYAVKHNDYGVYFLVRFDVDNENKEALLASIKEIFVFKFNTLIPKYIIERLAANAPVEYKRPASLEDNPQDIDAFLKRNEMEGLIKKGPMRKSAGFKDKRDASVAEAAVADYDEVESEKSE